MSKFEFVFVAKDENFKFAREFTSQYEKSHTNVTFNYVANNTLSLATVYNIFIEQHRKNKDIDFLVLMHADVNLDLDGLMSHIESLNGKYGEKKVLTY